MEKSHGNPGLSIKVTVIFIFSFQKTSTQNGQKAGGRKKGKMAERRQKKTKEKDRKGTQTWGERLREAFQQKQERKKKERKEEPLPTVF